MIVERKMQYLYDHEGQEIFGRLRGGGVVTGERGTLPPPRVVDAVMNEKKSPDIVTAIVTMTKGNR